MGVVIAGSSASACGAFLYGGAWSTPIYTLSKDTQTLHTKQLFPIPNLIFSNICASFYVQQLSASLCSGYKCRARSREVREKDDRERGALGSSQSSGQYSYRNLGMHTGEYQYVLLET
jgi:hypothetical protein